MRYKKGTPILGNTHMVRFRAQGFRSRVWVFRDKGFGFRVQGFGFRAQGLGREISEALRLRALLLRVEVYPNPNKNEDHLVL